MKTNDKAIQIDAAGQILGRLATQISVVIRGKDQPDFAYNKPGDKKVIVYNVNKIVVTGSKERDKKYYRHSGYLGNLKELSYEQLFAKDPAKVLQLAVKNMLPKNRLQKIWLANLTIHNGDINDTK